MLDSPPNICFLVISLWLSGQWWSCGSIPNSASYFLSFPKGTIAKDSSAGWGCGIGICGKGTLMLAFSYTQQSHKPQYPYASCRSSLNSNTWFLWKINTRCWCTTDIIVTESQSLQMYASENMTWIGRKWRTETCTENLGSGNVYTLQ